MLDTTELALYLILGIQMKWKCTKCNLHSIDKLASRERRTQIGAQTHPYHTSH